MEFKLKKFKNAISVNRIANIHYFEFTNDFHTHADQHAFRELVFVDSGAITLSSDDYNGVLEKNQLIIHRPNCLHSYCEYNEASSVIIIGFECKDDVLDEFSYTPFTLNSVQKSILTQIIKDGRSVFLPPYDIPYLKDMKKRKSFPFGADQLIKLNLERLLIELVRGYEAQPTADNESHSDIHMADIARYLDENYREKITLNELCFLFNSNKTTICNKFKLAYGESVISYINRRRITTAKKLLREGNVNMTQIASMVGFESIHYFSKTFKKFENKSPTEYINTIKARLENLVP